MARLSSSWGIAFGSARSRSSEADGARSTLRLLLVSKHRRPERTHCLRWLGAVSRDNIKFGPTGQHGMDGCLLPLDVAAVQVSAGRAVSEVDLVSWWLSNTSMWSNQSGVGFPLGSRRPLRLPAAVAVASDRSDRLRSWRRGRVLGTSSPCTRRRATRPRSSVNPRPSGSCAGRSPTRCS